MFNRNKSNAASWSSRAMNGRKHYSVNLLEYLHVIYGLVSHQLEVNAAGFIVLMVFDVANPQFTPDLSTHIDTLIDITYVM